MKEKLHEKKNWWKIFLIYLAINPIADIVFGVSQYVGMDMPINMNHVFRIVGILLVFFLNLDNKKYIMTLLGYSVWILFGCFITYYKGISVSLVQDLTWNMKMLMALGIFLAISNNYTEKWFKINDVFSALGTSAMLASLSIIIPSIFGIGFRTYGVGEWGFKGFFYTNNVISIFLLMIYVIIFVTYKGKKLMISAVMILSALLLIGTKTSLLGGLVITIIMLLGFVFNEERYIEKIKKGEFRKYLVMIIFAIVTVCVLFLRVVIKMLYERYQSSSWYDSLAGFIISNRDYQLELIKKCLDSKCNIFTYLFGFGYSRIESEFAKKQIYNAVEMDIQGVYYNFGVVVLLVVLITLCITSYRMVYVYKIKRDFKSFAIGLMIILGIGHGILAGHVVYEALSQLPFWLAVAYVNCQYKECRHKLQNDN